MVFWPGDVATRREGRRTRAAFGRQPSPTANVLAFPVTFNLPALSAELL